MVDRERLEEVLASLNKELKTAFTFGDDPDKKLKRISTGEPLLDSILGGGVPRRATTIFFGPPSSGKTLMCQKIVAAAQKEGLTAALVDAEYSFDPEWWETSGVNIADLIHVEPSSAEQGLEAVISLCKAGIDVVVVDSAAALVPEDEDEGGMEDQQMGLVARLLNKFFRKVAPHNKKTVILLINQTRAGVGQGGSRYTPTVLPGGKGQSFFSKVVVSCKVGEMMWKEGEGPKTKGSVPIGFYIVLKAEKNKTSQPLLVCEIPFYFTGETDSLFQLFQVALTYGIVTQGGPYFTYKDKKLLGRPKFLEYLEKNPDVQEALITDIGEVVEND